MLKIEARTSKKILKKAMDIMAKAKSLTEIYEENMKTVGHYVHATSRGHEAIQIAIGMQLRPEDWVSPYYRDDAMLLSIGLEPRDIMHQLMAKKNDIFSGGRLYYGHPSLKDEDKPKIIHQSSATGMQAIPTTGIAMGIDYLEKIKKPYWKKGESPIVVCSFGDASITEGEFAEAMQVASLMQLPILFLVQDNEWDISAKGHEVRSQNAAEYTDGFKGIEAVSIEGNDFELSYQTVNDIFGKIRKERRPFLLHARVPLLNHHTSGVRMQWYRDDLEEHQTRDPYPILIQQLLNTNIKQTEIEALVLKAKQKVQEDFVFTQKQKDPQPEDLKTHRFAPTPILEQKGERSPKNGEIVMMVDAGLHAIEEIMKKDLNCVFYGQDVGARLGGVFREAATLSEKFGNHRVFNTPIQEAFIIGSTNGMSAVGLKPIVEVQFGDYIWPGLNQLFSEISRSCYLTNGKWPISMVLRVPIGAYGAGGPYHSSSVESVLSNIIGIKIVYPSTAADFKGLMKAAYYDPNPVVILEHKGLYWSKVKGTDEAKTIEPSEDYVIPIGKGRMVQEIDLKKTSNSLLVITYGMGVYWALNGSKELKDKVEILDLRSIAPLDYELMYEKVKQHGKCLIVTEEPLQNTLAQSIAGNISEKCFEYLDAPVFVIGSENIPAIPLNSILEKTMILSADKVKAKIEQVLAY